MHWGYCMSFRQTLSVADWVVDVALGCHTGRGARGQLVTKCMWVEVRVNWLILLGMSVWLVDWRSVRMLDTSKVIRGFSIFCQGDTGQTRPLNKNQRQLQMVSGDTWVVEMSMFGLVRFAGPFCQTRTEPGSAFERPNAPEIAELPVRQANHKN